MQTTVINGHLVQPLRMSSADKLSIECIPQSTRHLRACLVCSMVKSFDQFEVDGCENCDDFLQLKNNKEHIYNYTSNNFDGLTALMKPEESWAGKWLRINSFTPGMYAISVSGRLPPEIIREVKAHLGSNYKSRDRSNQP